MPADKDESRVDCSGAPLAEELRCAGTTTISEYLGGLSPMKSIVRCAAARRSDRSGFMSAGCRMRTSWNYLVVGEDGAAKLLESEAEFEKYFAPIESPEEALSYAVARTKFGAKWSHRVRKSDKVHVDSLETTRVVEDKEKGGWRVLLFEKARCGCTNDELWSREVLVTAEGEREVGERRLLTSGDKICRD